MPVGARDRQDRWCLEEEEKRERASATRRAEGMRCRVRCRKSQCRKIPESGRRASPLFSLLPSLPTIPFSSTDSLPRLPTTKRERSFDWSTDESTRDERRSRRIRAPAPASSSSVYSLCLSLSCFVLSLTDLSLFFWASGTGLRPRRDGLV